MTDAFIYDAVRTPRGKGRKDGSLHEVTPVKLATTALEALGDQLEAMYLYHRFSDPTFVVADAVVRAVAAAALRAGGRAIDVCGGAGHHGGAAL